MKIVFFGTGYNDPSAEFVERAKPKLLKNTIVVTKDSSFVSKYRNKIHVIDYSSVKPEAGLTGVAASASVINQLKGMLSSALNKAGDVLYVAGCEPVEMAGLNLIQDICRDQNFRFHGLFIAPFLFQGKNTAERMRRMLENIDDEYKSISLYYADELLDLEQAAALENASMGRSGAMSQDEIFSMQNAYNVLEYTMAAIAEKMCGEVTKLDRVLQYTYDFAHDRFVIAVDPLKLILEMWYSIVDNDELFGIHRQRSGAPGISGTAAQQAAPASTGARGTAGASGTADSQAGQHSGTVAAKQGAAPADMKNVDTGVLSRLVGILNPEAKKVKRTSAYMGIATHSIPVDDFKEQTKDGQLDALVNKIKSILNNGAAERDPEFRKRMQERLQLEIDKFQARQSFAEEYYDGNQPTAVRDTAEAVASIYLNNESPVFIKEAGEVRKTQPVVGRHSMQTPYQRAARMAKNREESSSWVRIAEEKKAKGELPEDYEIISYAREAAEAAKAAEAEAAASESAAAATARPVVTAGAGEMSQPSDDVGQPRGGVENTGISPEDMADAMNRMKAQERKSGTVDTSMDFTYQFDDVHSLMRQNELRQRSEEGSEVKASATAAARAAASASPADEPEGDGLLGLGGYKSDWARKRAERQAAKLSKKLAKAEEKAAIAAAKAKQAQLEVELISRENEKELESFKE